MDAGCGMSRKMTEGFLWEVEETQWQTLLTPDKTYFECQSCGAVVMSQYTHVQWHREMDERCGG
jgi:hypothetical protein